MMWAVYTPRGKEFDLCEEAEALGMTAFAPRKVDMIRQGYKRRPEPVVSAYLPNYAFLDITDEQWHHIRTSKLIRSMFAIPEASRPAVMRFNARIEADYTARMAQIEAGERVHEYNPGDILQIIAGPLAGQLVRFAGMIERAQDAFPRIKADMDLLGQSVRTELDPLHARRATG